jgi:hypothetical protein
MEAPDITSRFFQSHVLMPDNTFAIPLTSIEFTHGREDLQDTTSGAIAIPHPLASPDTIIMEEATFKATIETHYGLL